MDFEVDRAAQSGVAREVAARQKAARLRAQQRELEAQAQRLEAFADAVEKGNIGERLTAGRLDVLDGAGWRVLNDRQRAPGSLANIDHIVVGPPGVLVIDSKHWTARVRWDDRGLYAGGYAKADEVAALQKSVASVADVARTVVPDVRLAGVLCFTQEVGLAAPRAVGGTVALEVRDLLHWMTSAPPVLSAEQVTRLTRRLDAHFSPRQLTSARRLPSSSRRSSVPVRPSPVRGTTAVPIHRAPSASVSGTQAAQAVLAVFAVMLLLVLSGGYNGLVHQVSDAVTSRLTPTPAPTAPVGARAPLKR